MPQLHPNQNFLNDYFGNTWKGSFQDYTYSGYALLKHVTRNHRVLDVGCGDNPFKGKLPNLVGVDPANKNADVMTEIENYQTEQKFDVAFCLGSINFGTDDIVEAQIAKVVSLLTPCARIFWRCNPGQQDHDSELCKQIDFYPWTFEKQIELADKFGFKIVELRMDSNGKHDRIYSEWQRIFSE